MLGKLLLSEGKTASADTVFSKLPLQYKNKMDQAWIEAIAMQARTRFYRHQFTGAVEALTELTENQLNQTALQAPALNDALELKLFISKYREKSAAGLAAFATASLLEYRRFYQEAVDTLDLFLNSSADSLFLPEAYALKAGLLVKAGRDRQALEMLKRVTTKYSNHSITDNLLYTAAEIAMRLKKFKDAVRYYETILVSHPGSLFTDRARQQIRKIEDEK